MTFVGGEKPSLDDLVHYGTKGMKWGVRKANPTTTEIRDARLRQRGRESRFDNAIIDLNLARTDRDVKSAVKRYNKAVTDLSTSEDAVTAQRLTKGEKWTLAILSGPVGLAVIGGQALVVKSTAKRVDRNREKVSKSK